LRKITVMIIPDGTRTSRQFQISRFVAPSVVVLSLFTVAISGYFVSDYIQLRDQRIAFAAMSAENEGLKGEARYLMSSLEKVKISLRKVDSYSSKLSDLIKLRVQKVRKKTGIGPLSPNEIKKQGDGARLFHTNIPVGVEIEQLVFNPVFRGLRSLGNKANHQAFDLKNLLSTLGQQKSLLASVPALMPVSGWKTSGYGHRISPFTGKRAPHKGIDIAAPEGTAIFAPADGVVIFTGAKSGFGNFIMIAHGYGVVTRYGHNDQNMVQVGQKISRGDQIATVGMTGRTTGPHLHYEIWVNGHHQNPNKFLLNMEEI
jgi:murein DD-endopeptidase MepM/ murein hydrolase activator NlpD